MRTQFENWFKTTEAYKLIEEMNYFKVDLFKFKDHKSQYKHSAVQIAYMTYQHQQSKLDDLQLLYMQQGVNMFKMQKRLDAALEVVKQGIKKQVIGKQCSNYYLEKVEELLEGGGC